MINTEIRLITVFSAKDGEALYSQHKQHQELTVAQISSVSSIARLFPTLCDAMDCSMPGLMSIISCQSLPKFMSIASVMPSNHLILCHPLLLLPSIVPSIKVFSDMSALRIRWPKYWSFIFNISPSMNTQD